jgi:hypothetical protein
MLRYCEPLSRRQSSVSPDRGADVLGVVHILISSKAAEHRLPQQTDQRMAAVPAGFAHQKVSRPPSRSSRHKLGVFSLALGNLGQTGVLLSKMRDYCGPATVLLCDRDRVRKSKNRCFVCKRRC